LEHSDVVIGGPREQSAQIETVGLQGPAPVAGQKRHCGQLVFVETNGASAWPITRQLDSMVVMASPSNGRNQLRTPRPDWRYGQADLWAFRGTGVDILGVLLHRDREQG
jgi:hypothetical protein